MDLIEGCCGLASPFIIIYIIIQVVKAMKESNKKKKAEITYQESLRKMREEEKEARRVRLKQNITENANSLTQQLNSIEANIRSFLSKSMFCQSSGTTTYDAVCTYLDGRITQMQSYISQMKESNDSLVKEYPGENMSSLISQAEANEHAQAKKKTDEFKAFYRRVRSLPFSKMMDEKNYGRINKIYWDVVHGMTRTDALKYITAIEQHINNAQVEGIYAIDIEKVMRCVWFFASEKPFSALDFQKAKNVFLQIYKQSHVDIIIADLYAKKTVGGENALREPVRDMLKYQGDAHILTLMASSLMWMNAYQIEHMVLQHMLATGKEMTAKTQERLHSLTNGGGKAPSGFDVKSSGSAFYFDVSALAWRDDEYVGLFENLAFQDKNLTYSLAIRDENKELFIPQGINVPSNDLVLKKFSSVFTDEYGNSVTVRSANCVALSGSGEEKIDGILASSGECNQMGILIHIARIGKKLIIKFYTLFMPTGSDLAVQKQQALSIYKKLSPSVTMWESSLKDTMLMAVEQILNSNTQGSGITNTDPVDGGANEPIF